MKLKLFLVSSLIIVSSCKKEVQFKLDDFHIHPVVNAILCAGDSSHIWLSYSYASYDGSSSTRLDSAMVIVSGSNKNRDTFRLAHSYDYQNSLYTSDLVAVSNEDYSLIILVKGYDTIKSMTHVPSPVNIDSIKYIVSPGNYTGDRYIQLNSYFKDPQGENFYYFLLHVKGGEYWSCWSDSLNDYNDCFAYIQELNDIYWETDDPAIGNVNKFSSFEITVFNDNLFDRSIYGLRYKIKAADYSDIFNYDTIMVYSYLYSVSSDLYYYCTSLNQQTQTSENPFIEPISTFSNIENGYGIFAGISLSKDSIKIATNTLKN